MGLAAGAGSSAIVVAGVSSMVLSVTFGSATHGTAAEPSASMDAVSRWPTKCHLRKLGSLLAAIWSSNVSGGDARPMPMKMAAWRKKSTRQGRRRSPRGAMRGGRDLDPLAAPLEGEECAPGGARACALNAKAVSVTRGISWPLTVYIIHICWRYLFTSASQ